MSKIDAEALLMSVMQDSDRERVDFSTPPPWKDIYPPFGFIESMTVALDRVQAKAVHYYGLADETILRWLCSRDPIAVSVTDMASWWGVDMGAWDVDDVQSNPKTRVPPELRDVKFYDEGVPRVFQAFIQDMKFPEGDFYLIQRRMMGGPHCIACLGPAIEQFLQMDGYEWEDGPGYRIGVWKPSSDEQY